MRIGIISTIGNAYSWAGSEEMWHGLAVQALDVGHQVQLHVAPKIESSHQVAALKKKGVRCYKRPDLKAVTRRLANRQLYSRYREFFNHKLNVICISMGGIADCIWMPDLLASLAKTQIPYLVIVQANAEGLVTLEAHRKILRKFYGKAVNVIFVSKHNHQLAERQLGMSFPQPLIICNPLREPIDHPIAWPPVAGGFHLAEVARLEVTDKQQDHLLEALASPEWEDREWTLTFFGSGADETHIHRLVKFYHLQDKVKIGGFVSDFRDIWPHHHLHVLPSRREGMPLSLIESMACGRPAIVTRAGGSPELVDDKVNGFVCSGMHPEVLRDTLEQAWALRDQWQGMGLKAAAKIQTVVPKNWTSEILKIVEHAASPSCS